jgi:hypothetical protein
LSAVESGQEHRGALAFGLALVCAVLLLLTALTVFLLLAGPD